MSSQSELVKLEGRTSEELVTLEGESGATVATLAAAGADPEGSGNVAWRTVGPIHSLLVKCRGFVIPMLNDLERNRAFEEAIRAAVQDQQRARAPSPSSSSLQASAAAGTASRAPVRCFDVGAGTGLLSMLAARHGAEEVHAIEQFTSVAHLARATVGENGLASTVTVHDGHTDTLGALDDAQRADIVVSEILDSQLLHEGVDPALRNARAKLLKKDGVTIPQSGAVWGVLVGGDDVRKLLRPVRREWGGGGVMSSTVVRREGDDAEGGAACCGDSSRAIPIRLMNGLGAPRVLSKPFRCFEMTFGDPGGSMRNLHSRRVVASLLSEAEGEGEGEVEVEAEAVLVWWRVRLYGDVYLSTEPRWARPPEAPAPSGAQQYQVGRLVGTGCESESESERRADPPSIPSPHTHVLSPPPPFTRRRITGCRASYHCHAPHPSAAAPRLSS